MPQENGASHPINPANVSQNCQLSSATVEVSLLRAEQLSACDMTSAAAACQNASHRETLTCADNQSALGYPHSVCLAGCFQLLQMSTGKTGHTVGLLC